MDPSAASLDRIEILRTLPPETRAVVARQCRWRRCRVDEQIIDHLSETRDVCFVVEGAVRVVSHSVAGREISFDEVTAGGFLGELAALDGGPRSASAVAISDDTLVAFLSPRPFQDLVGGHPQLAMAVLQRLCRIVRQATGRIMDLSTLGANNRVHAEILRLAGRGRRVDGSAVINPVPLHGDIAARVSTTRETVARVLGELSREGLVIRRDGALVVTNMVELEAMVEDVRGT